MHLKIAVALAFGLSVGSPALAVAGIGPAAGKGAGGAAIPGFNPEKSVNSAPGITTGVNRRTPSRRAPRFAPDATQNAPK